MKKILTSLLLLACCATVGQAQMPVTVQRQLPTVIEQFNQEKPFLNHAYWYVLTDVDSDGFNEFAITDFEKQFTSTFKITNEKLERIRTIPSGNVDWKPIFYIYSTEGRNANLDVTLKHRPLFLNKIQIAKNRFSTNNGTWMTEGVDVGKMKRIYDRIIFKPHIGNAKFVSEKSVGGNGVFTFALTDAAMVKKMFRGYSDYQATPFIVPKAWLNDHNVLNYTRWLNGEKENPVSRDALGIISRFYGGRKVIASKWNLKTAKGYCQWYVWPRAKWFRLTMSGLNSLKTINLLMTAGITVRNCSSMPHKSWQLWQPPTVWNSMFAGTLSKEFTTPSGER